MQNRFKVIIFGRNIYKEIDLCEDMQMCIIGTTSECDIRLRKEIFFGNIELQFIQKNGKWSVLCSDNIYFSVDSVMKMITKELRHGDEINVKYQESDNILFTISFLKDFDYENKDFNKVIKIDGKNKIKIGGIKECDIYIKNEYLENDSIDLIKDERGWEVVDNNTRYGVYVNGVRVCKSMKIQECDFIEIVGNSFYYKSGRIYLSVNGEINTKLNIEVVRNQSTHFKYPKYNRNTRIQYGIQKEEIEIQNPIPKPQKSKKNLLLTLAPSLVMLALTIVLRGIIGGGGSFVIYSAVTISVGVIVSIITYFQDNKEYKEEWNKRIIQYQQYIGEKENQIQKLRQNELRTRNLIYQSIENEMLEVEGFGKRLFERSIGDKDFLNVYLGKGRIESSNQIVYKKQEFVDLDDPLYSMPEDLVNRYRYIENAPIIADFNTSNAIGVVGGKKERIRMIKNITFDIAIRHFFKEIRMVYIMNENLINHLEWVRWLRNVENNQLDIRNLAYDEESRNVILEYLYVVLSGREKMLLEKADITFSENFIVFVLDSKLIATHPVSKYISKASLYGFTFVFLEEYEENLPQGCDEIIRLQDEENGIFLKTKNGDNICEFRYPHISNRKAECIASIMSAITVDEVALESELTSNITLFELLGIISQEDLDLKERWDASMVYKSMAAPLGVKNNNEIVYLDISDKPGAHGPHGLVAGTTGSGKSEILQSYILSMVTLFHPYEVGFVIIDFKGGGMANQFKNLPHLLGTITNIDGREINRSLLSIKAELIKRQEIFSENNVNHINDYIKLYKNGKVKKPLPHLIMIVDEFAELKAEYPDFMKELISAARIGRTLGIHLILATQKPAGVVDSQIWSNSNFKLCLKVQTKEDSNEVLKTPLAAEIREPGRAYFQVGSNEVFELFQSAYSGANVPGGNETKEKIFEIYERNIWGKKGLCYTNKQQKQKTGDISQLEAIVHYVAGYCEENNINKLPGICLPALDECITTDKLEYIKDDETINIPIGIFDDPEQQSQGQVVLDILKENIFLVGSAQTGKTVFLQTVLYGLINKYSPEQVNLYLVDCGSMVLKIFESSFHVGGVVLPNEEEKCENLFKMLNKMISHRKHIFSGMGIGNYAAYLESGKNDIPLVVVVIDNISAFKEYFPNQMDEISILTREAQSVGITFIITSSTTNALNYRIQANFSKKISLNCNDSMEYSSLFGHCKKTPKEISGRGLVVIDKRILEFQTAIFGKSKKEAMRSEELKQFLENRNEKCKEKAKEIPMVPERLLLSSTMQEQKELFRKKGIIPIGMEYSSVEITFLDMLESESLVLLGNQECKNKFLQNILLMLGKNIVFHNVEAMIIDDKVQSLIQCTKFGYISEYTSETEEGYGILQDIYENKIQDNDLKDKHMTLIILNNSELMNRICSDRDESNKLLTFMKNAINENVMFIFSAIENQNVSFNASVLLKTLKETRKGILFSPLIENKFYDVSGRIKTENSFGRYVGYRFNGTTCSKIKIFE